MPDQEQLLTRIEGLEAAMAGQTAAMAGAEATQAAAQAGVVSTNAAMQAGTMAAMVAGGVSLVVGIFLGIAITKR